MTLAFKLVFVVLLELCLFVEYDLGKIPVNIQPKMTEVNTILI